MKTILITGAAGNIGGQLRRQFAGKYKLRLSEKRVLGPTANEASSITLVCSAKNYDISRAA
jgi:short-subunit dehydrogenase